MNGGILLEPGGGHYVDLTPFGRGDVKAAAKETGDIAWVCALTMDPLAPPVPPHLHRTIHEFVYVLAGEGQILLGDQTMRGQPGVFYYAPPGTMHSFAITGERFRLLLLSTPASAAQAVEEALGRLYLGGSPSPEKTAQVFAGLDIDFPEPPT